MGGELTEFQIDQRPQFLGGFEVAGTGFVKDACEFAHA